MKRNGPEQAQRIETGVVSVQEEEQAGKDMLRECFEIFCAPASPFHATRARHDVAARFVYYARLVDLGTWQMALNSWPRLASSELPGTRLRVGACMRSQESSYSG